MKSMFIILLAAGISLASADEALHIAGQLSLTSRYRVKSLLEKAEVVHRAKRQVQKYDPRAPERCVLDCLETMNTKLKLAFPELGNVSESDNIKIAIRKNGGYDAEKFETFCAIYSPSSQCLHKCPENDLKTFSEKSFTMLEFMCINHFDDFRKYGPCLQDSRKETEEKCDKQCGAYEASVEKLANMTYKNTSSQDYDLDEMSELLNHSCIYITCLMECDRPIITQKCGEAAADLEKGAIQTTFKSLNDFLASPTFDSFWPKSCWRLGQPGISVNATLGHGNVKDNGD